MTKVLVVEDDPINMELMLEIIKAKGFTAHQASDGKEAIEKAQKELYDLILMDIMPGVDGIEVVKIIKNKTGHESTPVIALTAYAMKGDKERLLEAGFDDYVSKPIDVSDFMEILEKYRKREYRQQDLDLRYQSSL